MLKHVVSKLRKEKKRVLVMAHTGQAANAVHGITTAKFLHGMGGFQSPLNQFKCSVSRILQKTGKSKWWSTRGCDVCVIEEYSQIDPEHFARIMYIFNQASSCKIPIVLFGDPLQCPPIPIPYYSNYPREQTLAIENRMSLCGFTADALRELHSDVELHCRNRRKCINPLTNPVKYIFQLPEYTAMDFRNIILDKPYRQAGDLQFYTILNKLRIGLLESQDLLYLVSKQGHLKEPPVSLCTTKKDVQSACKFSRLSASKSKNFTNTTVPMYTGMATISRTICEGKYVHAFTNVDLEAYGSRQEFANLEADAVRDGFLPQTEVYIGQRIMLNQNVNLKQGLFNGRVGIVTSLIKPDPHPDGYSNPLLLPTILWDALDDSSPQLEMILYMIIHVKKDNFKDGMDTCKSEILYHLPISDCSALTWNRAQGKTLSSVHVNLPYKSANSPVLGWMPENGPYVSLSRARSLSTLSVSRINASFENLDTTAQCLNATVAREALQFWNTMVAEQSEKNGQDDIRPNKKRQTSLLEYNFIK
tara:strand:+ start:2940 stop:4535 length:1596 start_codon:yes stop_codon:yes gene_type:complete